MELLIIVTENPELNSMMSFEMFEEMFTVKNHFSIVLEQFIITVKTNCDRNIVLLVPEKNNPQW